LMKPPVHTLIYDRKNNFYSAGETPVTIWLVWLYGWIVRSYMVLRFTVRDYERILVVMKDSRKDGTQWKRALRTVGIAWSISPTKVQKMIRITADKLLFISQ
jgi:hypothetical protein